MTIRLSENFRALFYAPFYATHAIGAYEAEGVDAELVSSADPTRTAAALHSGEIDVMWGGPLRVMLTHARDPAADSVCPIMDLMELIGTLLACSPKTFLIANVSSLSL